MNIAAFFTVRCGNDHNFVRLVAGSSESEKMRELLVVMETLAFFDVEFKKEKIIALSTIPAGIPGGYNRVVGGLWCKVKLKSFYVGEDNVVYLNVTNTVEAMEILSRENIKQCPKEC
ncbi:hypothetical protein GN156_13300 [bacterium LRH843]|nr:hypothetical protein [bacterium LRH843]